MLRSKLLPAGCALALILPACVDNDTSLYVTGVLAAEPPECDYKADPEGPQWTVGMMDVGFTTTYQANVLVALQLATRGDKAKLRTESMTFQVRGAEVRLTDSVGDLVDEFSVPAGGSIMPTSADTPGYGFANIVIIPNDVGTDLQDELGFGERRTLVAEIRVFGDTLGGSELTSGSLTYVIEVCHACRSVAVEDGLTFDPVLNRSVCNNALTEGYIATGCMLGQEGTFDCRFCLTETCRTFGD